MSNLTATLKGYLDTALADTADSVWGATEKTNVLTWALANLWPRCKRPLDPTAYTVTLVDGTYRYTLDSDILLLSRVDLIDSSSNELGPIMDGSWEVIGDAMAGTAKLHVSPTVNDNFAGGTLQLNGYGRYDGATNLIPDDLIPLVLATARAELLRRTVNDRARFKDWQARAQQQNSSVNELVQMLNDADQEASILRQRNFTFQKPVPGRV